jgi:nucleoside-diphosphate-sugar epimerase
MIGALEFHLMRHMLWLKIAGIEMCKAYHGMGAGLYVMPTNFYGPGDNHDLENAHVWH